MTVGGAAVKVDKLGPVVVNTDGTLSRIANWHAMSAGEQRATLRLVGRRNQARMRALREQGVEGEN